MPETATEEPDAEVDETTETNEDTGDDGGEGLLNEAETDVDEGGDSQYDSLPDHMVDEQGEVNTKELYKSYQGLVQQVPDAEVASEDVIGQDGKVDVDTLIEQRSELRKRLSQQDSDSDGESTDDEEQETTDEGEVPESPDEYDLDDEAAEELGIDKESDAFGVLKEAAHESELNTDQFENFVSTYLSKFNEQGVNQIDVEEEKAKLADDAETAEAMINEARQWVDGLYQQGKLTEEEHNAMLNIGNRAEGVRAIVKLRNEVGLTEDIPEGKPVSDGSVSWSEIEQMMEDERYQNGDPEYDAKVRKKIEQYNAERA